MPSFEIPVVRSIDKSSKSTYTINDKKSSFKEVQDLLQSKEIDLEFNRFLILQVFTNALKVLNEKRVKLSKLKLMKPKAPNEHEDGLLEYIEACIGMQKYTPMIEKAEKAVEELNESRIEKLNSVRAAEKEKKSLEVRASEMWQLTKYRHPRIKLKNTFQKRDKL